MLLARAEGPAGFAKLVALKRIHPHLAREPEFIRMFLDEARIASQIDHANVCSVFDFGTVDDLYYIAMEYLAGESLASIHRALSADPDPEVLAWLPGVMMRIGADLCEGLHAAHELVDARGRPMNVVHRDVSPHNLFITYDGVAKVVDFGVASAQERLQHTTTGQIKGKTAYMAPELLTDAPLDRTADVWSLGVVLWELLARRRLFHRRTPSQTLFAVVSAAIEPPSTHAPNVPRELDAIVLRALARARPDRYQTARELGRALVDCLATQPYRVGLAEVSEWMDRLFPRGRELERERIERATTSPTLSSSLHGSAHALPEEGDTSSVRRQTDGATVARTAPRRWPAVVGPVVAAAAALAVGWAVWGAPRGDAPPSRADGEPAVPRALPIEPPAPRREPSPAVEPAPAIEPSPAATGVGEALAPEPAATPAAIGEEPEEENSARPSPRPRGFVSIATPDGWADVYARGRSLGQTPLRTQLPAGRHVLEVRHGGRRPGARVVVDVRPGVTRRVVVSR